jgi:hypothetical protein
MIRGAQAAEGGLQGAGACAPLGKQMPALGLERRCSIVGGKSIFFFNTTYMLHAARRGMERTLVRMPTTLRISGCTECMCSVCSSVIGPHHAALIGGVCTPGAKCEAFATTSRDARVLFCRGRPVCVMHVYSIKP